MDKTEMNTGGMNKLVLLLVSTREREPEMLRHVSVPPENIYSCI
jgi:hypothetical protein